MNFKQTQVTLEDTHAFSELILDYANQQVKLKSLINDFPSEASLRRQIELKGKAFTHRTLLHKSISSQYTDIDKSSLVQYNIDSLLNENTFTICTAHQPSIFTGHLYFIYKIAHAITLARHCQKLFPHLHFVPIYYMGSEDDDIEEIGSFFYNNKKYKWQPEHLEMSGRLTLESIQEILREILNTMNPNHPEEKHLIDVLNKAYQGSNTLGHATRILVNELFGKYGLIVVDGDDVGLKTIFSPILKKELGSPFSAKAISTSLQFLEKNYHVQAEGRSVNLFYIQNNKRDRIEVRGNDYVLAKSNTEYSKDSLMQEAIQHPNRFSPNVILRPLYQEMILPNVAFIGGGGEVAYWLQLKALFDECAVPYPLLILRNSYLVIDQKSSAKFNKLDLSIASLFASSEQHKKTIIKQAQILNDLNDVFTQSDDVLKKTGNLASKLGPNLIKSVEAHLTKIKRIQKRLEEKFSAQINKQHDWENDTYLSLRSQLFPDNQLQERHDNFLTLYKQYHSQFINYLIENGHPFGATFSILMEEEEKTQLI